MGIRFQIQRLACILAYGLLLLTPPLAFGEGLSPEEALRQRAQAFWEARVKEDYAGQYAVLEPKVKRTMTVADYIKGQGPLQYLEARIGEVKVEAAKGLVQVWVRARIKLSAGSRKLPDISKQEHEVKEKWVRRHGEWYRLHPQEE